MYRHKDGDVKNYLISVNCEISGTYYTLIKHEIPLNATGYTKIC